MTLLAAGTALLVFLALQSPPTPDNAGTGVAPLPTQSSPHQSSGTPQASRSIVFIGDSHLDDWAAQAGEQVGGSARVESGVSLFDEPTVDEVLDGDEPEVTVLSIGADDVLWADDFQFGLTEAIEAVRRAWADTAIVVMRPAWTDPGDLEAEKDDIAEQVARAQRATYLDADATASSFAAAWNRAGL